MKEIRGKLKTRNTLIPAFSENKLDVNILCLFRGSTRDGDVGRMKTRVSDQLR